MSEPLMSDLEQKFAAMSIDEMLAEITKLMRYERHTIAVAEEAGTAYEEARSQHGAARMRLQEAETLLWQRLRSLALPNGEQGLAAAVCSSLSWTLGGARKRNRPRLCIELPDAEFVDDRSNFAAR